MRISNARWIDDEGRLTRGCVEMSAGRLSLEPGSTGLGDVDAAGGLVLPGLIDAHTHLRTPGQEHKEGVERGTQAALIGGVTTVLDMPNDVPPTASPAALAAKEAAYRAGARCHWGHHYCAVPGGPRVSPDRIGAAKLYMARSSSSLDGTPAATAVEAILESWPRVVVHAEDERLFRPREAQHHLARPRESIVAALATLEEAMRAVDACPRVVLAHASTAEEVAWAQRMKDDGFDLWVETCPHYLHLAREELSHYALYKVNPPIRTRTDRRVLREALADGTIDLVSTDHAPHTPAEKASGKPPSGIAGIEWLAPLLLKLVDERVLTWERMAEVLAAPAACYGLTDRGVLRDGAIADLAVLRRGPGLTRVITGAASRPYAHLDLGWEVAATCVAGALAWDGTDFHDTHTATGVYA